MQLLYFGWVRSRIGKDREDVELPESVTDVRGLIKWLSERGGLYTETLSDISLVRVAVNQELTDFDAPVARDDEVAFFPPMTGG